MNQQHFIYDRDGNYKVVWTEEYNELLKTDEWFATPKEAKEFKPVVKASKPKEPAATDKEPETHTLSEKLKDALLPGHKEKAK